MITPTAPRRVKGRAHWASWYAHAMSTPGEFPVADVGAPAPDQALSPEAVHTKRLRRLLEKYELLVSLTQNPPGRTIQRRDEMRVIAERFPAALREWDQQPPVEIERRRQRVAAELQRCEAATGSAGGAEKTAGANPATPAAPPSAVALAQEKEEDWLRYGLDVHDCLRAVLQLRRHLSRSGARLSRANAELPAEPIEPSLLLTGQRVVQDCGVPWLTVTPELLRRVAQPAQGRLAAIAYAAVAQHHKSSAAAIKEAIFGSGHSGSDHSNDPSPGADALDGGIRR